MLIPSGTVRVTPDANLSLLGLPGEDAPDGRVWEPSVLSWMEQRLLPPGTIWDFGGGAILSALLLGLAWPRGRVLTFASPQELDLLRVNIVHAGAHNVSALPLPPADGGWLEKAASQWPGRAAEPSFPLLLRFDLRAPLLSHWQDALETLDSWDAWLLLRTRAAAASSQCSGSRSGSGSGAGSGFGSGSGSIDRSGHGSASAPGSDTLIGVNSDSDSESRLDSAAPCSRDSLAEDLLCRGYALVTPLGSAHLLARRLPAP